ncbi:MAG: hypothetical protein IJA36_11415 [Lachnospiraceae bacterium]|nr:hypothetical protein [Lachnospiraceae bacterium]
MEQLLNGECLFCQIDEQIEYSQIEQKHYEANLIAKGILKEKFANMALS